MSVINLSISIISTIIYLCNIVSVFLFAAIIVNKLYVSKKFSKSENFDLYNDLFSWETFFISIGIENCSCRENNENYYLRKALLCWYHSLSYYCDFTHIQYSNFAFNYNFYHCLSYSFFNFLFVFEE